MFVFFFFKQKTAYEMRISDWSSDVCSSDLYVHDSLYDAMCDAIAGLASSAKVAPGSDAAAEFGPVQNKAQYQKVLHYLAEAGKAGKIVAGGEIADRKSTRLNSSH